MNKFLLSLISLLLLASCGEEYTPKQKGYFRIEFPKKEYVQYSKDCPFTFDAPTYAGVYKDSSSNAEPCWLNVRYPYFNAALHLTYKNFKGDSTVLAELEEQSRKYAYEHTIKAQDIKQQVLDDTINNLYITTYTLEGETATPFRFYATDNKQHFIDGAFYFNHRTNIDSIAPVQVFLMQDVMRLLETFSWK